MLIDCGGIFLSLIYSVYLTIHPLLLCCLWGFRGGAYPIHYGRAAGSRDNLPFVLYDPHCSVYLCCRTFRRCSVWRPPELLPNKLEASWDLLLRQQSSPNVRWDVLPQPDASLWSSFCRAGVKVYLCSSTKPSDGFIWHALFNLDVLYDPVASDTRKTFGSLW